MESSASSGLTRFFEALFGRRNGRRLIVLLAGISLIAAWQAGFAKPTAEIPNHYKNWAASGIHQEWKFFFFLYHLGYLPLATDAPILKETKNEAERLLRSAPDQLRQDEWVTFRSGDRGRVYLYYPDAWLNHHTAHPSLRPAHALAFILALLALWTGMWWIRRPWLGAAAVIALGSNPFQLHSIHNEENVFSWSITAMAILLAIHLPLMVSDRSPKLDKYYPWIAAFGTAIVMSSIRTVRSEPMPMLLGAVLVYITLTKTAWWKRIALVVVLASTFTVANIGYAKHLQKKFDEAAQVIRDVGGEPYTGPLRVYHEFWHAVFCGLGDFDKKYGYEWNDLKAYRLVYPHLQQWHPELQLNPNTAPQNFYYDKAKKYPVYYGEVDERYHDIVKNKILGDIKNDPKWYIDILEQRVWRILTETTPVTIATPKLQLQSQSALFGLGAIPLLGFLLWTRRWFYAKLLVFSTPLAIPALVIYSDRGMAWYSCFHIFSAVIMAALMVEGAKVWSRRRGDRA